MEHSAVLLTDIKLPHGFKSFVLSIFVWLIKTGFTVHCTLMCSGVLVQMYTVFFLSIPSIVTLYILDTGKHVIWQTVKIQMKCCKRRHIKVKSRANSF